MRRRHVLALLAALWMASPLAAHAEPGKPRRIAILAGGSPAVVLAPAFTQALRALGYGDQEIAIEVQSAEGHPERLPNLAAELVRLGAELIITPGPAASHAARKATATIPIVMVEVADPVGAGLVANLAHPGGNVTGLANLAQDTAVKRLELLKTVAPDAQRVAMLLDPGNRGNILQFEAAWEAASGLGITLLRVDADTTDALDAAFGAIVHQRAEALFVPNDPVFLLSPGGIPDRAANHRLPAIYQSRGYVAAGGLISYGAEANHTLRRVAVYVDKILKGAKPADLPVEQPTKLELVINLNAAKVLGLTVPQSLLQRADEVIE